MRPRRKADGTTTDSGRPSNLPPPALVSPHSGPGWDLPEPEDLALPPLRPGPAGLAVPRAALARTDIEQATQVVWGALLDTEPSDPVVARLLADVPVLMSGIRQIKGRLYLYLGIDRAWFNRHGGESIYHTLTQRFPTVPFYIEPSDGVQPLSAVATVAAPPAPTNLRAEAITDSSARVRWDAAEGTTDYDVNYKPAQGGRWTNWPHRGVGLHNTITGLEPATAYRWAVRAENSDGYSAWVFGRFWTLGEDLNPLVMGGDRIEVQIGASKSNYRTNLLYLVEAGTLTLGGLTTADDTKGFVVSGHGTISGQVSLYDGFKAAETDALIFGGWDRRTRTRTLKAFLGKLMQLPHIREEVDGIPNFFYADAAFVAYPSLATANCSLTWTGGATNRTFCLDLGRGEPIETVMPLAIRGKDGAVYNVVGSKTPTIGLGAWFTGGASGGVVEGNRVTSDAILARLPKGEGYYYTYGLNGGGDSIGGDSGSPIYTVPDRDGNVRIVGILHGGHVSAGEKITFFSSWDDVEKELDLQPISP